MMIINGGSRRNGGYFAGHLMRTDTNERATVLEIRGLCADNVADALKEMEAVASGTRLKDFFYHANINPEPGESLTPEQWRKAVDTLEKNLGLTGQPRFVVEHVKEGRTHQHVIWSRVDLEHMRGISDSNDYEKHQATARELEISFGLRRGESVLAPELEGPRPQRTPEFWEMQRAKETGIDPRDVKAELSALWRQTDSGRSFHAAALERGYIISPGDRRDFVLIDSAGTVHSLARRLDGVKAAEVRQRMADIDRASLPSMVEAQAIQFDRQQARETEKQRSDGRTAIQIPEREIEQELAPATPAMDAGTVPAARRIENAAHGVEKAATKSFATMCKTGEKLIDLVDGVADFFFATPRTVTPQQAAASQAAMVEFAQAAAFERRREMAYDRMMEERAAGKHLTRDDVRYLSEADRANYRRYGDTALDQMLRDREIEQERKRTRHREL